MTLTHRKNSGRWDNIDLKTVHDLEERYRFRSKAAAGSKYEPFRFQLQIEKKQFHAVDGRVQVIRQSCYLSQFFIYIYIIFYIHIPTFYTHTHSTAFQTYKIDGELRYYPHDGRDETMPQPYTLHKTVQNGATTQS